MFMKKVIMFTALLLGSLTAHSSPIMEIPVLNAKIKKGDIITKQMIASKPMQKGRLASTVIMNVEELVGLEALRPMRPNVPIYGNQLRMPPNVHRGDRVTVIFKSGSMVLKLDAKALEDGYAGESIKVTGASNNTIMATIQDGGVLTVN